MLGFNDMSTLVDHFVSSPRERENKRGDSRGDEREGQGRKSRNETEETEEIKTFPPLSLPATCTRIAGLAQL